MPVIGNAGGACSLCSLCHLTQRILPFNAKNFSGSKLQCRQQTAEHVFVV